MKKNSKGFTLLELMMVIGFLAFIGTMMTAIFFTSLKSSTKTKVMQEVKQKGDFALGVMEKMIRNAQSIESCGPTGLSIVNKDSGTTTFSCSSSEIASNSAVLIKDLNIDCANFCTLTTGVSDEVIIDFTLTKQSSTSLVHEEASIQFKTTVAQRSY